MAIYKGRDDIYRVRRTDPFESMSLETATEILRRAIAVSRQPGRRVTFTDEQKKVIATAVETGNIMSIQRSILDAVT